MRPGGLITGLGWVVSLNDAPSARGDRASRPVWNDRGRARPAQLTPFRFGVETIFRRRRKRPETKAAYFPHQPNNGDRHAGPHPERDLPQIPHHRASGHGPSRGKAMTEAVMALSVFFSVSIFLAHAFDAYRMR
jgi:hypothetical protein